LSFSIFLNKL